jgi:hypothetical protein
MTNNLWIELSDDSAQNISGGFDFGDSSLTLVKFGFLSGSAIISINDIKGNTAIGESDNSAFGTNTFTNGVVINKVVQGFGSSTKVTGVAAAGASPYYGRE